MNIHIDGGYISFCRCVCANRRMCTVHYAYRKMRNIRIPFFALWSLAHTHSGSGIYFLLLALCVITFYCIFYFYYYYLTIFLVVLAPFVCLRSEMILLVAIEWLICWCVLLVFVFLFSLLPVLLCVCFFALFLFVRSDVYKCACVHCIYLRTELFFFSFHFHILISILSIYRLPFMWSGCMHPQNDINV